MAKRTRRDLQTDVEMIRARYGEDRILVDDEVVIDGGVRAMVGVLRSGAKIVEAVRIRLAESHRK